MNSTNATDNRWLLNEELEGSVIAVFVLMEFLLSLSANLFISVYTLLNAKKLLKKSSIILLFNLALGNLLMVVLYMPFVIVASAAEEWIIGNTDDVREGFCQFTGFVLSFSIGVTVYTLAAISFDRFLFIVKPHLHQRWMTWKTTLGIVIFVWVLGVFLSLVPYTGVGEYDWSPMIGGCVPLWTDNRDYLIISISTATIPLGIIIITSAWTFIFTRWFLKKDLRRLKRTLTKQNLKIHKSIYSERLRNLIGIFGMLLLFNLLSWCPYLIISSVALIVGIEKLPAQVFPSLFILYLLSNVTNPLIQSYFRKEILGCIKACLAKVPCFTCLGRSNNETNITSSQHDDVRAVRGGTEDMGLDSHEERGQEEGSQEEHLHPAYQTRSLSPVDGESNRVASTLQFSVTAVDIEDTSTDEGGHIDATHSKDYAILIHDQVIDPVGHVIMDEDQVIQSGDHTAKSLILDADQMIRSSEEQTMSDEDQVIQSGDHVTYQETLPEDKECLDDEQVIQAVETKSENHVTLDEVVISLEDHVATEKHAVDLDCHVTVSDFNDEGYLDKTPDSISHEH